MKKTSGITAMNGLGKFALSFLGTIFKDAGIKNGHVLTRDLDWRHIHIAEKRTYPIVVRGHLNGKPANREVDCDWVEATYGASNQEDWHAWLELHRNKDLARILSNTSEKGFKIDADLDAPPNWPSSVAPNTHVGRFIVTLRARMEAELPAVPYYPMELGENNAQSFRNAFSTLIRNWAVASVDWALSHNELVAYLDEGGVYQCLVDQIVPNFVRNLAEYPYLPGVYERYGANEMAIVTEPYREWVIQGEPWLDLPGVVQFTDDPTPYALRKVGILNLADVLKVRWGIKQGWNLEKTYKWQAFEDVECREWLNRIMLEEVFPALEDQIPGSPAAYWETVCDRYRSKAIPYTLGKVFSDDEMFRIKVNDRAGMVAREYKSRIGSNAPELCELMNSVGLTV